MAKKEPKPEQKKQAETPTEQPGKTEQPASAKSDIRIFVALCRWGVNIAGIIDLEALRKYTLPLPNVVASEIYLAYCTEPGAVYIKEQMEKSNANRLLVAAWTPKTHEPVFKSVLRGMGMDDSFLEFANLREHDSFVHMQDKPAALAKAKDIIRAAVARAAKLEPIPRKTVPVTKEALVIGGGIGGLQAALDLAKHGFKVHLVEKEPTIGGKMAMLDRTFPTDDCSIWILGPVMLETARNPNINLLTYAKVTDFKGYVGNYEVEVTKTPRYVKPNCNGCGACVDVCPAWGANAFDWGMSPRKAIYIAFAQAVPAKAQIDMNRCIKCGNCENVCELESINLKDEPEKIKLKVGTVVVATGWDEFKPETGYLGYGVAKNVITQGQLERALAPNGPIAGNLVRPSDGKHPHSVLFIQCVGSRDKKHNVWCSAGVCCMISVKNSKLIQQHLPGSHIAVAYIDMRCGGKMYDEYYAAARESGVLFLRGKVADVKENPKSGGAVVVIEDAASNEMIEQEFDLVILSASMQAPNDLDELNSHLRLERSPDGFFKEYHARLNPVDAKVPGIHFAGVSQGPKSIAETIMQAKGAASSASIIMQKGEYTIDLIRAVVDLDRCSACGLCERACPYEAITTSPKGAAVDEIRCRGCGTCCSVCPSASISLRYYRDGQYQAYIDALLEAEPLEPAK